MVFAGSLAGLEGQGGPSRVPGQERLEGWVTELHPLFMSLRVSAVDECDFAHGGSKSECSKRQEVLPIA